MHCMQRRKVTCLPKMQSLHVVRSVRPLPLTHPSWTFLTLNLTPRSLVTRIQLRTSLGVAVSNQQSTPKRNSERDSRPSGRTVPECEWQFPINRVLRSEIRNATQG